jgi:hypothetical protein
VTTTDLVPTEKTVNPRFWMDERSVDTLSQKLTVPLQLQFDSVSDGLKEEYRSLLGSLREDLYSLKMEISAVGGRPQLLQPPGFSRLMLKMRQGAAFILSLIHQCGNYVHLTDGRSLNCVAVKYG